MLDCDLDIAGVDVSVEKFPFFREVRDIRPYQPPETLTQAQLKMRMLAGVDITVLDGVLTGISWDERRVTEPIRIRLSDYAGACSDCILSGCRNIGFHKLTLVLDDNIEFGKWTFDFMEEDDIYEGVEGVGVAIDVRDIRDEKKLEIAYLSFIHDALHDLSGSIIDFPERQKRMLSVIP